MKNKSSTIIKTAVLSFLFIAYAFSSQSFAQTETVIEGKLLPYENETMLPSNGPCITKQENVAIRARVQQFKKQLEAEGKLDANRTAAVGPHAFRWPLAPDKHYHQFSNYYISNYVDLNSVSTGLKADEAGESLEDYNCGNRTYDVLSNGYDHTGIDISTGPFGWTMMDNEDVDVVAAEGGVIAEKLDGEFDRTCSTPSPNVYHGNWIGITHSDGSTTYYMHMKSGSLTSKVVGDNVSVGEYLGKVGSSGNSTGPHLHFQVEDNFGDVLDPFQNGSCATGAHPSLWANEEPYYNQQIVSIFTLSAPWSDATCDSTGASHGYSGTVPYCNHFNPGDMIWFSASLRDILYPMPVSIKVYNPSGSLIYNFSYTESNVYRKLRTFAPNFFIAPNVGGNYKMQCTYAGITRAHYFTINCPGSITLSNTRNSNYGFISGGTITSMDSIVSTARNVQYQAEDFIQLNTGFRAVSGCEFTAYIDNCTIGSTKLSETNSNVNDNLNFALTPNPASDEFTITGLQLTDDSKYEVQLFNAVGSMILKSTIDKSSTIKIKTVDFPNGIYLVQIKNNVKTTAKKLVVQH